MSQSKTLVKGLLGNNFIMVNRTISKFAGFTEAGILAEMLDVYDSCEKNIRVKKADGEFFTFDFYKGGAEGEWFYLTKETMEERTGMKRTEYDGGIKNLMHCGLIHKETKGLPAKMYFHINWDQVAAIMTGKAEKPAPLSVSRKPANKESENLPTRLQETDQQDCRFSTAIITKELELNTKTKLKQDDDDITRVPQLSESYYPEDHLQEIEEQKKRIEEAKAKEEPRTPLNDMFKAWDKWTRNTVLKQHQVAQFIEFLDKGLEEIAIVEAIERSEDADHPFRHAIKIIRDWYNEGGRTLAECLQTPSEVKYRAQQEAKVLRQQMQELKQASGTNYTGGNRKPDIHTQISHGGFESLDFLNPTKNRVDVTGGYHS